MGHEIYSTQTEVIFSRWYLVSVKLNSWGRYNSYVLNIFVILHFESYQPIPVTKRLKVRLQNSKQCR
jgi:hypothetical protein